MIVARIRAAGEMTFNYSDLALELDEESGDPQKPADSHLRIAGNREAGQTLSRSMTMISVSYSISCRYFELRIAKRSPSVFFLLAKMRKRWKRVPCLRQALGHLPTGFAPE